MSFSKKLLIAATMVGCGLFASTAKVYAGSGTASIKGFSLSKDLSYIDEYEESYSIDGDKWHYGSITLWTATYSKYYDGSMYYFILVEAICSSNTSSLKNGYYRMVNNKMTVNVQTVSDSSFVDYVYYSPDKLDVPEKKETQTLTYGMDVNLAKSKIGIDANITWKQEITYPRINFTAGSIIKNDKNVGTTMKYVFEDTANKKLNDKAPIRGATIQRSFYVFEVEHYNKLTLEQRKNIKFKIDYTGEIQKMAILLLGCSGCEKLSKNISIYSKPYYANCYSFA